MLLFALPVASFLVLGAHFLREGAALPTLACGALALALAWRQPWLTRVIQAALVLGTVEWIWTAYVLVQQRIAAGRPWGRLLLILAVVAFLTAASIAAVEALRKGRLEMRAVAALRNGSGNHGGSPVFEMSHGGGEGVRRARVRGPGTRAGTPGTPGPRP